MKADEVEESLRKRFKKELFTPFCKAINEYDLIQPNDKIAVCISGGKDSFLLAKLFQELKRRRNYMEARQNELDNIENEQDKLKYENIYELSKNKTAQNEIYKNREKQQNKTLTKNVQVDEQTKKLTSNNKSNKDKNLELNKSNLNKKNILQTELNTNINGINNKTKINQTNAEINNKTGQSLKAENKLNSKIDHNGKNKENRSFELVFLCMDPGYNKKNRQMIEKNAKLLNIPITFFETDIFANVEHVEKSPCYLCARMRRGYLYSKAKELGCNKIALGHHFDDVIETTLMGLLYSGQFQTMMPKLKSTNFKGMQLIRPMYLIRESDILQWCKYNELKFIQCACKFTEGVSNKEIESKRKEIKSLIANLKTKNPFVETNIFKSAENVNLSTVISYKKGNKTHHFLDEF